ncbi:hypothetical protein GCM10023353_31740 [Tomitella cavernea]|uniref:Peptidase M50 n=1 Tax=Tomitella cavernea TaxID=1387982 RepID=A0ABP9D315_9ACTN|nr:hypothetical protein [Tomitella cavernea]
MLLRCGDAPIPVTLPAEGAVTVSEVPAREELAEHLPRTEMPERVIVAGQDAALAAVLTHLLRSERLDVEVAFVPATRTDATRVYSLEKGAKAGRAAMEGAAHSTPLIRDDLGVVLVGCAQLTGPDGGRLTGETYVDHRPLFTGEAAGIEIQPTGHAPGLRAARLGRMRRKWIEGRAAQTGGEAIAVTRDGMPEPKRLKRSTFYRHNVDWLSVR